MAEEGPLIRFLLARPRPVRLIAGGLMLAAGAALLTLPVWRRLIW
jgi:hypothetical protein